MKYNKKPEDVVMNYSIAVVDSYIISLEPHIIRDYILTCLVKEPEPKKIYPRVIRLTREEVERLKKKRSELERELNQSSTTTLEGKFQKLEIERKLNTLDKNLRTIDEYLNRFGEIEPLGID